MRFVVAMLIFLFITGCASQNCAYETIKPLSECYTRHIVAPKSCIKVCKNMGDKFVCRCGDRRDLAK